MKCSIGLLFRVYATLTGKDGALANRYQPGDKVIFTLKKYSHCPSREAKNIFATPNGEAYEYEVDTHGVVIQVLQTQKIRIQTHDQVQRLVDASDHRLRKATWPERFLFNRMFPRISEPLLSTSGGQQSRAVTK